ncbi:TolC family protein [Pseudogulbenkiania subflava]|uniref:Outer membrane protein TolC n=1 Tax=Pseudogulbenkiania subflava DSM 22618 TaxID=1123014 RepID=A0A1Y6BZ82_9NEIS|nr:TolC family protein [Pseudogulbenkiania subflava]SMF27634.1 Outer membrane protein TolC [Pseudogulbenkiania subflava DSM 22618]
MIPRWMRLPLPLSLAGLVGLAQAAPLTFNAALEQAENTSPTLAAQRAQVGAAQFAVIPAGALPDPKLFVGVDNYPVSGPMRGSLTQDFMTMQKVGVMQEFPNADKRRARVEAASAGIEAAAAQSRVARLKVRREAALAWLNRYAQERKLALFGDLERENRLLATAVRAQIASGRAQPADAVIPKQEAALLADRHDDLARDLAKANAELRRLIGPAADEPLAGDPPAFNPDADTLRQHLHRHPELLVFSAEMRKAEADVREAVAMKKPDWGVELAYQKRGAQFGDMVSVQFTFDLPIFTSRRQDPTIAAKQQELLKLDAEREAMLRDHTNELDGDLANYAALERQAARARQEWLPLAQQKVDLATASYQAGKTDLTTVLSARRELIEQRFKLIDLDNQRASTAARLYFAYGENEQ